MLKSTLKYASACLILSILTIFILYTLSQKKNHSTNGFTRYFLDKEVIITKKFNLKYSDYYIAGFTLNNIYLANYQAPLHIVQTNLTLSDTVQLTLNISDTVTINWRYARMSIDSPHVYLNEGASPGIFYTTLDKLHLTSYMKNSVFFTHSLPISKNSIILRSVQAFPRQNILIRQTQQDTFTKTKAGILEKQIDGIFCTDGMLNYDKRTGKVVYLYYYRNEFICMDTSLTVTYKSKTIDTTSRAKIKIATVASEGKTTLSAPPVIVNKNSCLYNNRIFIMSDLIADNEDFEEFKKNAVIDTYSLVDGKYILTLPN